MVSTMVPIKASIQEVRITNKRMKINTEVEVAIKFLQAAQAEVTPKTRVAVAAATPDHSAQAIAVKMLMVNINKAQALANPLDRIFTVVDKAEVEAEVATEAVEVWIRVFRMDHKHQVAVAVILHPSLILLHMDQHLTCILMKVVNRHSPIYILHISRNSLQALQILSLNQNLIQFRRQVAESQ